MAISSADASHEVLGLGQFAPFVNYLLPPSLVNTRSATPFASHISAQNGGYDNGAFNITLPPLPARNDISPPKPYHLSLSGDSYYAGLPDRTIPPYKRHWRSQQRRRTSSQFDDTRPSPYKGIYWTSQPILEHFCQFLKTAAQIRTVPWSRGLGL